MLTYLTSKGLSDPQIQLISGHESKKSLEVYQHLSLESIEQDCHDAVRSVGIWTMNTNGIRCFHKNNTNPPPTPDIPDVD